MFPLLFMMDYFTKFRIIIAYQNLYLNTDSEVNLSAEKTQFA